MGGDALKAGTAVIEAMAVNTPLIFPPRTLWLTQGFLSSHTTMAGKKGKKKKKEPGHGIKILSFFLLFF